MAMRWIILAVAAALVLPASVPTPARAAGAVVVDLALVLAVDVSMSIDEGEAGTQRSGYIHALRDKRVADAIRNGPIGRVALTYVEWSSPQHQTVIVPWRIITDAASAQKFADELDSLPYKAGSTTSISAGLDFAVRLLKTDAFEAVRRVIDVSGDGYSDYGRPVTVARDAAVAAGITVNGLAIMNERPKWKQAAPADLDTYYRDNVIGGPGSFHLAVRNLDDFSRSVLQKMVLEIAGLKQPRPPRG